MTNAESVEAHGQGGVPAGRRDWLRTRRSRPEREPHPSDVVIRLERTACFGECPVYSVAIDGDGNVVYEGAKFVRVVGRQTDRIPASRVAAILDARRPHRVLHPEGPLPHDSER